jgi:hypothetical protein
MAFDDGLAMQYEKKKELKVDTKVLTYAVYWDIEDTGREVGSLGEENQELNFTHFVLAAH